MEHFRRLKRNPSEKKCTPNSSALWRRWLHRFRTRKQLREHLLDDPQHVQHDLGLCPQTAMKEINKPFWRQ